MSFHRGGIYAVNLGLDPDNVFRLGGWSAGSSRWQVDMNGSETVAANITAGGDIRAGSTASRLYMNDSDESAG